MALAGETTRIVSQFDFSDDDVNAHVKEFLAQMGKLSLVLNDFYFYCHCRNPKLRTHRMLTTFSPQARV